MRFYHSSVKSRLVVILAVSVLLLVFLTPSVCTGEGTGEHAAVLYANDGQAVYTVNPNNGVITHTVVQLNPPLGPQMTWDQMTRKLYMTGVTTEPTGYVQQIFAVDPSAQNVQALGNLPLSYGSYVLSYRGQSNQLIAASGFIEQLSPTSTVDVNTGALTPTGGQRVGGQFPQGFFDSKGDWWVHSYTPDTYASLQRYTYPRLQITEDLEGRIFVQGDNYPDGTVFFPRYVSFSFHPHGGQLFATYRQFGNPGPFGGSTGGDFHTVLCTVDLNTGQPKKTIAVYDKANWDLHIAWAF